jgi:hypothetical protein
MKTNQFQELIQAVTGRQLILDNPLEEIPLGSKVSIRRPYGHKGVETVHTFDWKTPKKEDSLLRSFITAFCSKYKEPDPETYSRNFKIYGDTWEKYAEAWNSTETHWNCSLWSHHASHQTSKEKLKSQVIANFARFDSNSARLGFYETNYGIGIFTIYGGEWVEKSLSSMSNHLVGLGIPYRNELSDAGWVTRFVIGLDKPAHSNILGKY